MQVCRCGQDPAPHHGRQGVAPILDVDGYAEITGALWEPEDGGLDAVAVPD
jgi:hypothetical protein